MAIASSAEPNILVVDHCAVPGGAQLSLVFMVERFERVSVVLLEEGPLVAHLREHGLEPKVHNLNNEFSGRAVRGVTPRTLINVVQAAWKLRRVLAEEVEEVNADIVILNSLRATLLVRLSGACFRLQKVVMVRDGLCPPYLGRAASFVSRLLLRGRRTTPIANSHWTARQTRLGSTKVVSPFISPQFFTDLGESREAVGEARVLLLGRISPWKGQDLVLRATRLVEGEFTLTCAGTALFGEEEYESSLHTYADSCLPAGKIKFLGHVHDVVPLIDEHDILIHSSTYPEPFGQVVLQGMARGKIVIAADAGGPAEMIEDGENGFLYPAGDMHRLAALLQKVLNDREALRELRERARRSALAYSSDESWLRLTAVLRAIVEA